MSDKLRRDYEAEVNVTYNLVIATRWDILFLKELNLSNILKDFDTAEINNTVFYTDVPDATNPSYIMNTRKFICGIDLFFLAGPNAISKIADDWFLSKRYLTEYKAENIIAKLIDENKFYLNLIQYPAYACWRIKRTNEYLSNAFLKPFLYMGDLLLSLFHPLFLFFSKYQQRTFSGRYHALSNFLPLKKIVYRTLSMFIFDRQKRKNFRRKGSMI